MARAPELRIEPVTEETLDDFEQLFSARGAPHYCWCANYRFRKAHEFDRAQRRAAMRRIVLDGTPVGVLAYAQDEPVGWCSVAPRESYVKLERSRTMPRVSDVPTWTVFCFFVQRSHRAQGVSLALLRGAVEYALGSGAQEIEGYPWDTAGISSRHRGRSTLFRRAGFRVSGKRWVLRKRAVKPRKARKVEAS